MKNFLAFAIMLLCLFILACTKDHKTIDDIPDIVDLTGEITSPEFDDSLLFVNSANFQIQTSKAATFTSSDSLVTISKSGLITKIYSGEIMPIDVTWTNGRGSKTRIYALGATDDTYANPYWSMFHYNEAKATDPYASYRQGWETLKKLYLPGATIDGYAIILRHGDASWGTDYNKDNDNAPANWWLSCDSTRARQLNAQGIERSTVLGTVFEDLSYPIGRVITSEFCRAKSTAELINAGPTIVTDARLNHANYNLTGLSLFANMISVMKEQPVDNQMTLIVAHHPMNEVSTGGYPTFPDVSPFPWTGGYFVKQSAAKEITFEGSVSWAMFKYFRDWKKKKL